MRIAQANILFALVALPLSQLVSAADWRELGGWKGALVDMESVVEYKETKTGEPIVKVWTRRDLSPPIEVEGKGIAHSMDGLYEINCARRTYSWTAVLYSANGGGGERLAKRPVEWNADAVPETFPAALVTRFCKSRRAFLR